MDMSAANTAKPVPGHLWPLTVISLGTIMTFGWIVIFVWLLLGFLMM